MLRTEEFTPLWSTECFNDWCDECRYPACVCQCHDPQPAGEAGDGDD